MKNWIKNIVKNAKFGKAKNYLKVNPYAKLSIFFQLLNDSKSIKQVVNTNPYNIQEALFSLNNTQILM